MGDSGLGLGFQGYCYRVNSTDTHSFTILIESSYRQSDKLLESSESWQSICLNRTALRKLRGTLNSLSLSHTHWLSISEKRIHHLHFFLSFFLSFFYSLFISSLRLSLLLCRGAPETERRRGERSRRWIDAKKPACVEGSEKRETQRNREKHRNQSTQRNREKHRNQSNQIKSNQSESSETEMMMKKKKMRWEKRMMMTWRRWRVKDPFWGSRQEAGEPCPEAS